MLTMREHLDKEEKRMMTYITMYGEQNKENYFFFF